MVIDALERHSENKIIPYQGIDFTTSVTNDRMISLNDKINSTSEGCA